MANLDTPTKAGYKQPWLWFILAPLICSVVVGMLMLSISQVDYDGLVKDNYYKEGLAINRQIAKDQRAVELNLSAQVNFNQAQQRFELALQGQLQTLPEQLQVNLIFPTRSDRDRQLILNRQNTNRYLADFSEQLEHRWYLVIEPLAEPSIADASQPEENQPESTWRLTGELLFPLRQPVLIRAAP